MIQDELLSNVRWVKRAKQFLLQAMGDTQQYLYTPVLILVQNKYPGRCKLPPQGLTAKLFNMNPEARDLRKFFSDIYCIILPFKAPPPKIDYFGKTLKMSFYYRKMQQTFLFQNIDEFFEKRSSLKRLSK